MRSELRCDAGANGQVHGGFLPCLCDINGKFPLRKGILLHLQIAPVAVGIGNTVLHGLLKWYVGNVCRKTQLLAAIHIEEIAKRRKIHLIGIFRADELLPRIRQLDRRTQDINACLCSCLVERRDIAQMCIVIANCFTLYFGLFESLNGVVICGDDFVFQIFPCALRREPCSCGADLSGLNTRLIRAAGVKRETCREIQTV